MLPLVSIMIPTFNQAHLVQRAIESCIQQDYENLEIIISDDCSTDNTTEVVSKYVYNEKVKYYRNSTNLGRVSNYNYSLVNYVKGEWVVNLDGDDFLLDQGFISYAINSIYTNKPEEIVFFQGGHSKRNIDNLDQTGEISVPKIGSEISVIKGSEFVFNYYSYSHFSHATTLYRRDLALKLNFYRFDILSTDIESVLRLALHGNVILSKRVFSVWTMHNNNSGQNLTAEAGIKNLLLVEGIFCELLILNFSYSQSFLWRSERIKKEVKGLAGWFYGKKQFHELFKTYRILKQRKEFCFSFWFHWIFLKLMFYMKLRFVFGH